MTKKLTPCEKEYRMILRNIRSGKIIHDSNFYLADFDELTMLVTGSLHPVSYSCAWMELQTLIHGFEKYGESIPYKVLLASATEEELKRLQDPEAGIYGLG